MTYPNSERFTGRAWISVLLQLFVLVSLVLTGCSTTKEQVLPPDGKPMQQIYEEHFQRMRGAGVKGARQKLVPQPHLSRAAARHDKALHGYTRQARDEIEARFPRLPNPTLVMFVYPHLAGPEGVPIPGYATTFPLYERVEYALPGEVPVFKE